MFKYLLFAILSLTLPLSAADPVQKEIAGLTYKLPAKWTLKEEKDKYTISGPDELVIIEVVQFKDVKPEEFKKIKTKENMLKEVAKIGLVKEAELEDADIADVEIVNGLRHCDFCGGAKLKDPKFKDKPVEWFVTTVEGGPVPLLFHGAGDISGFGKEVDSIFESLKKVDAKKK